MSPVMHHRLTLAAALTAALLGGCTNDALYTYCTTRDQCGSHSYVDDDDDTVLIPLDCVEVEVDVEVGRTTRGSFCTLTCFDASDCESEIGLADGLCIAFGDEPDFYCYQPCSESSDCYPSSACEEILLDGVPARLCLPTRL